MSTLIRGSNTGEGSVTTDITERLELPSRVERRSQTEHEPRFAFPVRTRRPAALLGFALVFVITAAALFADLLAPGNPWASVDLPFQPPSPAHLFGTDDLGRDLFAGVVHGARTSLLVGLTVTLLSGTFGVFVGVVSGYYGGIYDDVMIRLTEFVQVMPRFFLALVAVALFRPGLLTIVLILSLTSWTMTTRILRAQVFSAREREYVLAAKALGAAPAYILRRHVLPNTLAPVIVHASLMIGQVMLIEASLAFLGLGDPNNISWGYLLNNAQAFLRTAWWMAFFPGLALSLAVLGFNLLSDVFQR